jgi:SAM-dependent methyltransferase
VFCDISAGAGYYTLSYARYFSQVLHCDLSTRSLVYSRNRAQAMGIGNIVFLRIDYLSPPFRRSLTHLVCFDTLIYGRNHERDLLASIKRMLSPAGSSVVAFHNWWHNPVRRVGLLRRNYPPEGSYSRAETERLLREAGISAYEYFPFHQEFEPGGLLGRIGAELLPPTLHVYRCRAETPMPRSGQP